ncbi:hypothetical protein [Sphingomonas sp. PAMC 26605]|uniref:hypothetical protein n=1 Tax=Sphingomonas sp. PAMC 26605 TaxID=1112214 RepID=UPI001E310356|nr:hypothetical protein [Sphingomonas sp. PAMC 26605]
MKPQRHPMLRTLWFSTGVVLVLLSPLVGAIPGPGGIFVFAAGLALMLQNSQRAKRVFVDAKRRWPKFGHYADMGLRRPSAARRRARDRELAPDGPPLTFRQRLAEMLAPPKNDRPR